MPLDDLSPVSRVHRWHHPATILKNKLPVALLTGGLAKMREAGKVVGHQTQAGKGELQDAWGRRKRDNPAPATLD